jgi:CubicO group peptidase (beta-lactamase class C family)
MRRLVALLLLATAPAAFAARRRAVVPPPELAVPAADSIAAAAIAEGAPGLSVAVRKGDLTFARAYGLFDREAGIPARTDTVFSTGSLTKQFTAAAIVRLEDEGKLSIDDKARKFLPELDGRFDAITIRHLLHHTSGVREYVTQLTSVTAPKTRQEIFAMITGAAPLFPAGSRFEYSNSGYYLLGVIIEHASAQTYEQYVRDTFFTPMGLGSTSFSGETAPSPRGYTVSPGGPVTLDSVVDPSLLYANGSICSTASDLVRWTTSLAASPLYTRMIGDPVSAYSELPGAEYGFGLIIDTFEGRVRVWHGGGLPGFTSRLIWFPDEKITVAVVMNLNDQHRDRVGEVADAIAQSLFVQDGAVRADPTPPPPASAPPSPPPAHRLAAANRARIVRRRGA